MLFFFWCSWAWTSDLIGVLMFLMLCFWKESTESALYLLFYPFNRFSLFLFFSPFNRFYDLLMGRTQRMRYLQSLRTFYCIDFTVCKMGYIETQKHAQTRKSRTQKGVLAAQNVAIMRFCLAHWGIVMYLNGLFFFFNICLVSNSSPGLPKGYWFCKDKK